LISDFSHKSKVHKFILSIRCLYATNSFILYKTLFMELYPVFNDVDINDIHKDLNKAIYMLHYVDEEIFSRKEIQAICFSIKVAINTLEQKLKE
jgi:hypothetical protein